LGVAVLGAGNGGGGGLNCKEQRVDDCAGAQGCALRTPEDNPGIYIQPTQQSICAPASSGSAGCVDAVPEVIYECYKQADCHQTMLECLGEPGKLLTMEPSEFQLVAQNVRKQVVSGGACGQ